MTKEFKAALEAARHKIPFALFAYPGETVFHFMANPGGVIADCPYFIINKWNSTFDESAKVYDEMDATRFLTELPNLKSFPSCSPLQQPSTSRSEYIRKIESLIESLKERGGKTVFSRIISETDITLDLEKLLCTQFESFPGTFRFFYYTPDTGLWLGTSPEILFEFNRNNRTFRTMSLAGTRMTDSRPWDNKNIKEQNLVAEFISDVLKKNGATFKVERCNDVQFKPVCHICDMFSGEMHSSDCTQVINELSPTPALSGFPVSKALEEISMLESHQRECYGGYVGYVTDNFLKCYVNLRSLKLMESGYCIFAGGGITADSNPEEEWQETENKTMILRRNISGATINK
ncbi:MAG: hypothetical protein HDS55_06360 [Barnesiella sp.]|nr:hypothetical protein [Barnesiella sp.]